MKEVVRLWRRERRDEGRGSCVWKLTYGAQDGGVSVEAEELRS